MSWTTEDVIGTIEAVLSQGVWKKIPRKDKEQFGDIDEFIIELRDLADEMADQTFDFKLWLKVADKYNAEIQALAKKVSIYIGKPNGLKISDIQSESGYRHPFYMFYELATTKMINFLLIKLFHSYVKKEIVGELVPQSIKFDNENQSDQARSEFLSKAQKLGLKTSATILEKTSSGKKTKISI